MKCFLTRTSHSRRVPGPSCCTPSATPATDAAPPARFPWEKWLTYSDHTADPNIEPAVIANLAACRWITKDDRCLIGDSGTGKSRCPSRPGAHSAEQSQPGQVRPGREAGQRACRGRVTGGSTCSVSMSWDTWNWIVETPSCCSKFSPTGRRPTRWRSPATRASAARQDLHRPPPLGCHPRLADPCRQHHRNRGAHRCPINVGGRHAQAAFCSFDLGASVAGPTAAYWAASWVRGDGDRADAAGSGADQRPRRGPVGAGDPDRSTLVGLYGWPRSCARRADSTTRRGLRCGKRRSGSPLPATSVNSVGTSRARQR